MPTDTFAHRTAHLPIDGPAYNHAAITPSDTEELAVLPRAIRCNVGGDIVVTMPGADGSDVDVTYTVADGEVLDIRPKKIKATGTDAEGIVAWW
jgi:hypothetical protein